MNALIFRNRGMLPLATVLLCLGVFCEASAADAPGTNAVVSIYQGPEELTGTIYAKDSNTNKVLYTFKRRATTSGSKVNVLREYMNPDGSPAARERVFYDGDKLMSYELDELQTGAGGSVRVLRDPDNAGKGTLAFEYNKDVHDTNSVKSNTEALHGSTTVPDTLVGDMIATFIKNHWNEIFRGEKVKFRYVVVPRRETVGFTFVKDSEATIAGQPALVVRMEATSPIIAALVDPLYFTVEKASEHRVAKYLGRVVPKIKKGDKWDDLDALVLFDWK